eukprot:293962_1
METIAILIATALLLTVFSSDCFEDLILYPEEKLIDIFDNVRAIDVAADNDTLFVINEDYKMYTKESRDSDWVRFSSAPPQSLDVGVATANNVWFVIDVAGNIDANGGYNRGNGPSSGFEKISAASDGAVYAIDSDGDLYKWCGGTCWSKTSGSNYEDIGVGAADNVWAVAAGKAYQLDTSGNVYYRGQVTKNGDHVPLTAVDVGEDGTVLFLDAHSNLWYYDGSDIARLCDSLPDPWTIKHIAIGRWGYKRIYVIAHHDEDVPWEEDLWSIFWESSNVQSAKKNGYYLFMGVPTEPENTPDKVTDVLRVRLISEERKAMAEDPGDFLSISVASDGTAMAVYNSGSLYRSTDVREGWSLVTDDGTFDVSVVSADNAWVTEENGRVHHYDGTAFVNCGMGYTEGFQKVAATSDDTVYVTDSDGCLYKWCGSLTGTKDCWAQQEEQGGYDAIAVGSSDIDTVWAIKNGEAYIIDTSANPVSAQNLGTIEGYSFKDIDVGDDGTVILLDSAHRIYYYRYSNNEFVEIDLNSDMLLQKITIGKWEPVYCGYFLAVHYVQDTDVHPTAIDLWAAVRDLGTEVFGGGDDHGYFLIGMCPQKSFSNDDTTLPILHWVVDGSFGVGGDDKYPECRLDSATTGEQSNSYGNSIGVRCCDGDEVGDNVVSTPDDCIQGVTWSVAKQTCEDEDLQLCTRAQLQWIRSDGYPAGTGTGCLFDGYHIWTANECDSRQQCISLYSSGYDQSGDESSITFAGDDLMTISRGHNIAILDATTFNVIDTATFDTHPSDAADVEGAAYLDAIPSDNRIVAIVTYIEAYRDWAIAKKLEEWGCPFDTAELAYGESFIFLGTPNSEIPSWQKCEFSGRYEDPVAYEVCLFPTSTSSAHTVSNAFLEIEAPMHVPDNAHHVYDLIDGLSPWVIACGCLFALIISFSVAFLSCNNCKPCAYRTFRFEPVQASDSDEASAFDALKVVSESVAD